MMSDRSPGQNPGLLIAKVFAESRFSFPTKAERMKGEEVAVSTAEQIDAEIERLERQRDEALAQAEDSDQKLEEMNERRIVLAPPAFTGDEAADRELLTLEQGAGRLSRKARLARNAASELGRLSEEAKARLAKEERRVHLGRHVGLSEERLPTRSGVRGGHERGFGGARAAEEARCRPAQGSSGGRARYGASLPLAHRRVAFEPPPRVLAA